MPKVRNIQTGEVTDVTEDQLGVTLASGDYEPEQGSRIAVVNEFGDVGTIDAGEYMSGVADQSGIRIATPLEIAGQRNQQEYGEGLATLQAAAEGIARGATVGLSDALLRGLGVSAEGLRERKERNPVASGGGEAVGILGSVLLSSGAGGAGQAAGRGALATAGRVGLGAARFSPAGLIARGGIAAERELAQLVGKSAATKALTMGTVGAAEGALYGAGEAVSEAALGDHELTAERLLASAGHGAIWGGAAGGIMSLVGSGVGAIAKKAKPKKTPLKIEIERNAPRVDELVELELSQARTIIDDIPATAEQKNIMQRAIKSADDFVQGRRALKNIGTKQDEVAEEITRDISRLEEIRNAALADLTIAKKVAAIGGAMRESAPATPQQIADFVEDSMVRLKSKYQAIKDNKHRVYSDYESGLVKRVLANFDNQLLEVKKLARSRDSVEAGQDLFGILDQVKRDMGDILDTIDGTKYENRVMGKELREHYMVLRDELTEDNIWGTAAADIQRADNAAWSADLDTRSAFGRYFLTDAGGKKKVGGFGQIRVADYEKVKGAVRNADQSINLNNDIMRRNIKSHAELLEQLVGSHHNVSPGTNVLVAEAKELSAKILSRMDEAATVSRQAKQYQNMVDNYLDIPFGQQAIRVLAWAADAGYRIDNKFANGKIQSVLRSIAGETTERAGVIKRINQRAESVGATTRKAVDAFFTRGKRAVVPLVVTQYDQKEDLNTRYQRIIERHNAILDNQGLIAEKVGQMLDVGIAPNTSVALTNSALKAAQFLKSKQPAPNVRPSDVFARLDNRQRVADSEIAKYIRYVDGVEHPVESIKRFGETGDMPRETAEAIRTVYPKLFAEFETKITEKLIDADEPSPYEDLMRLSLILDRPLHPSLEGSYIAMCQNAHRTESNDTIAPSRRSMPNTSEHFLSSSQRLG